MAKSGRDSIHAEDFPKEPSSADSNIRHLAAADAAHQVEIQSLNAHVDRLRGSIMWGIGLLISACIGCAAVAVTVFLFWASRHNERLDRMESTAITMGSDINTLKMDTAVIKSQHSVNTAMQTELRDLQSKVARLEVLLESRQSEPL